MYRLAPAVGVRTVEAHLVLAVALGGGERIDITQRPIDANRARCCVRRAPFVAQRVLAYSANSFANAKITVLHRLPLPPTVANTTTDISYSGKNAIVA